MRSYNETQIRTPEKFTACRAYIEANPVRKHIVDHPNQYLHSSATSFIPDPTPLHLV